MASLQPFLLYRQGNLICINSFSRRKFLVSKSFCLQVGQIENDGLQLLQILWPPRQEVMGGTTYSLQTGHSSCVRTLFQMSDDVVSMLSVNIWTYAWLKKEEIYLKHSISISIIRPISYLTQTQLCFSVTFVQLAATYIIWTPQPVSLLGLAPFRHPISWLIPTLFDPKVSLQILQQFNPFSCFIQLDQ